MSILKGRILAMLQLTLTTLSLSSLKNNLQPPYELPSFFSLLFAQLQSWIRIPYIKTSSQLSLVTQLLQNTSPQMVSSIQTQTVYFSSTTEFMYYLQVISIHAFFSTIMITSLPDILVKIKNWNQSAMNTSSPAFMLIYNNSTSPVSLVCDLSHNVTSPMDLSNNSPSLNCCSNHQTQDPMITQVVKLSVKQSSGEKYKRTRQGVSAKLESYLYCYRLVHATTSCLPHVLLKAIMQTLCALISSSRSFYHILGL